MKIQNLGKKTATVVTLSAAILFGGQAYDVQAASLEKAPQKNYETTYQLFHDLQAFYTSVEVSQTDFQNCNWQITEQTEVEQEPESVETEEQESSKNPVAQEVPESPQAPSNVEKPETNNNEQQANSLSAYEQKVVELTNNERAKQGLQALQVDEKLSEVAREKSNDMQKNNYFDHNSPTYGSPFDMMKQFGVTYNTAGENIAQGQQTPEAVVQAWMDSPGHRENIMSGDFTHIGVGYVESGNYWTQQFIGK